MARPLERKNLSYIFAILIASFLLTITFVGTLSAQELITEEAEKVLPPDLSVTKTASAAEATPGDAIGYTILIENVGDDPATLVNLEDVLPDEVDYIGGSAVTELGPNSATLIEADVVDDVLTWQGVIGVGSMITIGLEATIAETVTIGTMIVNTATVSETMTGVSTGSVTVEVVDTPPADLDITKTAEDATVELGGAVVYTILVENNGPGVANSVEIMDMLGGDLTYVAGSLSEILSNATATTEASFTDGVLTWEGLIGNGGYVELTFEAKVSSSLNVGDNVSNEAEVNWNGMSESDSVNVEVGRDLWFFPIIASPLNTPSGLMASRPVPNGEGNNASWTVIWGNGSSGATYEIQESKRADFSSGISTYTSTSTHTIISQSPSPFNDYYYRVRAVSNGNTSPWSETLKIVGPYRDDFDNSNTGWEKVRVSFLEEVYDFYETDQSWFVLQVEDRWDWGIASPLRQAPIPPYVIEFRSEPANIGNLLSHGAVFSGDYTGNECIIPGTVEGAYQRTECFNHFYNTNLILQGDASEVKLVFERVDELVWCPGCGGSAVKRLTTDTYTAPDGRELPNWPERDSVPGLADGFNTYRIEVFSNTARFYANGQYILQYEGDNPYYNDRYFGVFASTDEYNNSTWRFDYFQVLPLSE